MTLKLKTLKADITTLSVDAVVNAANCALEGGGGVDGAIHRAAGPELHQLCRTLGGCEVGRAKITPGFNLPARWIIHTVGPIWHGGESEEIEKLRSCYRESLVLAEKQGALSVAFPSISTGAYGFPIELASQVAVAEVSAYLAKNPCIEVTFACFSDTDNNIYESALSDLQPF
ncbi:MAG: O-acetyl-ADP-ribose deacetylase [Spirulinaceae cyanobacterium RM2_2_10]|nr:O-acetyl-ADP-ribose deacetylase [Spirulinaceae cyanobacterium RM2_2_10]